jgi:hypothetical protein
MMLKNIENSRIWIYTLSKELSEEELTTFKNNCDEFVKNWKAHDIKLDASCEIYKNRILIIKVNEDSYNASGCSIDAQIRFIKNQEKIFQVELLNRMLVAYEINSELIITHQSNIKKLLQQGMINKNTLVYNNTLTNSIDLENKWKVELKDTWLATKLN